MGENTGIEWTQHTWNPWRGCTKVSPGCANCYMFTDQRRYGKDPNIVVRTRTWSDPIKWQKAAEAAGRAELCFTCSWSDWFHEAADEWRPEAWDIVRRTPNIIYQILTKRSDRIAKHLPADWGNGYPNVWLGVSIENQKCVDRILDLVQVPARVRFLSVEPLLGPVDLGLIGTIPKTITPLYTLVCERLHWVIVGGESGPGARPCNIEWIRDIVAECRPVGVPCFVKQLGSGRSEASGRSRAQPMGGDGEQPGIWLYRHPKGADPGEWPPDLIVREYPAFAASPLPVT